MERDAGDDTELVEKATMKGKSEKLMRGSLALAALLAVASAAYSRERPTGTQFKYVGGTRGIQEPCEGSVEVGSTALTFKCPAGSVSIPYSSISLMQYRPDISRQVWKLKLKWKPRPTIDTPIMGNKRNRYFTVLYAEQGATEAMVLDVAPEVMRPYLAEIDLKAGRRVEVKNLEQYD
jgi:hypothetical protein